MDNKSRIMRNLWLIDKQLAETVLLTANDQTLKEVGGRIERVEERIVNIIRTIEEAL